MNLNVPSSHQGLRQTQDINQRGSNRGNQKFALSRPSLDQGHKSQNNQSLHSQTLNNSQIHGRKIDSPKIHVKEQGDNRPKTSAQQIRKYTLNESQQLSNLNVQSRIVSKKQQKKGKDNARTVQQKFHQAGITSATSGKNTKSLLMTQMGLTAPLTNKEVKKFDFESTKIAKQSQTPHPSNVKSQKQKFANLPPKTRNQALAKVPAIKSTMKTSTMGKKRHSSQSGVHGAVTSKSSTVPNELFHTPMHQTQRVGQKLLSTKAVTKGAKNSQKSTQANQNSFGGLPSQSSRTGRTNHYQGASGQVASTIAAAQAKRGRRTKSENRYTKKQAAQRFNKSTSGNQKHTVHQKLRRSGEIIGSPVSDSLLSSQSHHKRTKSPTSGSHPELRKKLAMFNQSSSCGRAPEKKQQTATDLLSLSSMSSASAGHLAKTHQQITSPPNAVGQQHQQAAGQSFSRLLGKSYFVDGEQFLRHMSPGTPTGEDQSLGEDGCVNLTTQNNQEQSKMGQRAISVTHRPNSKAGKVSNKPSQQHSSEILGNKQFSQSKSIEVEERYNRNMMSSTQPGLSNQMSAAPTFTKSAKHTLNMLSMLSNKASNKSKSSQNYGCFQTENQRPNKSGDPNKTQSHSFLNLTQKISTSSAKQSKGFDKMIKQNIKRKNKKEAEETLKKFMQESRKAQKREELTMRNQEIQRLNALRAGNQHTSHANREELSADAKRIQAFSIVHNNQQKTPCASTTNPRSKSCIEKFFSGSSIRHQAAPPADRDTSIVLEIKQLKREINEEMRNDCRNPKMLNNTQPMNNYSSVRMRSGLVSATAQVVEEKLIRAKIDRKKNSSNNELHIDQGRIHKFIMKQKRNRIARQTKEKTIEQEKQIRRKQNLQDLDNYAREGYKRKAPTSAHPTHLRHPSQSINIKKGESMLNKTSFSIKKQMDLLKNSTQPLRRLRPKTIDRDDPTKELLGKHDLNEFIDHDEMYHQREWDRQNSMHLEEDKQIINIRRKNSSSKSRKRRDLSNSHSNSSPQQLYSSESRRRQQHPQPAPAQKVLIPSFKAIDPQTQPSHPLRRRPNNITNSSFNNNRHHPHPNEFDQQLEASKLSAQQDSYEEDPSDMIYQTLDEHDISKDRRSPNHRIRVDADPFLSSLDPPAEASLGLQDYMHARIQKQNYMEGGEVVAPPPQQLEPKMSIESHYSQPEREQKPSSSPKARSPTNSRPGSMCSSEVKNLIRRHSAAVPIQYWYRQCLRQRGFYSQPKVKENPYEVVTMPKAPACSIDVKQVSESKVKPEGTTSPMHALIPPLRLDNIKENQQKQQQAEQHPYIGLGNQGFKQESDRPVSTARSVFERNDFEQYIKKMEEKGLLHMDPKGNGKVSTQDFPELLKLREEAIQQYESNRTMQIQQKYERKQYSPRTYEVEMRAVEVWVTEERKEVKKRKKAFEKEQVMMFKEMEKNETNQKQLVGFFPALGPTKSGDFRLASSNSYRTGGPASSRREMSSQRNIIEMINDTVPEESDKRPRTISEDVLPVSQGPEKVIADLSAETSHEYASKSNSASSEPEQVNFNDIDVKDPLKEIKNPEDNRKPYTSESGSEHLRSHPDATENEKDDELEQLQQHINSPSTVGGLSEIMRMGEPGTAPAKKNEIRSLDKHVVQAQVAVIDTPMSSIGDKLDGVGEQQTELKRSAGSTELHTAVVLSLDEELAKNKPVSPKASDIVRGTATEQIASSKSSNAFINNIERGQQSDLEYARNQIEQEGGNFAVDPQQLTTGQSPRASIAKSNFQSAIRIEIDGKDPADQEECGITTNMAQMIAPDIEQSMPSPLYPLAVHPVQDNIRSPYSAESDISIKCGGNSIKSGSSADEENTFQKGPEAEDPHLYQQPKESQVDPIKAKLNDQLCQFGEEFTNEIFNMLIAEMHIEMDVMVNRNAPAKGIFKQNQGIKTDLFAIEKYIDEVQTEMLKPANKQQFIEAISAPLNKNAVAQMEQMQDSKTGSFTHFIDTFPQVLPLDLYLTLEKRRKEAREKQIQDEKGSGASPGCQQAAAAGEVSTTFIAECEHIHNKVLFDCINDSLLQFKPYSKEGEPMPWSRHTKRLKPADDFTIQETFEIVKHDLFRAAITQAGLLPRREFIIKGVFDEEIFGEFREKKLVSLLAHEMIENENKWLNYEFEEAQVKIDVGDIVLEQLVQEAIELLQKNQDREF